MADITITVNAASAAEAAVIKNSLQKIASNLSKENLVFIADLAVKPDINNKLKSRASLIKMYV